MNLEIILNTIFYSIFLMKVIETIQINAPDSDLEQLSKCLESACGYISEIESNLEELGWRDPNF